MAPVVEFEIDGRAFQVRKLDAFKQLHLTRKLAPLLPKLLPVLLAVKNRDAGTMVDDQAIALFVDIAGPFAEAFGAMGEADVDYITQTCLSAVRWGDTSGFHSMDSTNDLDLGLLLQLVVRVLRENLGNFIQGLLAKASQTSGLPAAQ